MLLIFKTDFWGVPARRQSVFVEIPLAAPKPTSIRAPCFIIGPGKSAPTSLSPVSHSLDAY